MKQLWFLLSVVGLIMYAGFAIQTDGLPANASPTSSLADLELAVRATGATVQSVTITGWAAVAHQPDRAELLRQLGWTETAVPQEIREPRQYNQAGQEYISIRWVLTGRQCREWQQAERLVRDLLKRGTDQGMTVEFEATSAAAELNNLTKTALDAIGATDRQAWSGPADTIVAGKSAKLPGSPFGINVQIEARRITGQTRLWIAWPALRLDS